jgi:hypothetical protein
MSKLAMATTAVLAGLFLASSARAEIVDYAARLGGSFEVPRVSATGVGIVKASLDTQTGALTYTAYYYGLTGEPTAAHFHGPADEEGTAAPVVPVEDLTNVIEGTATLDAAQMSDLENGLWYFNLHTEAFPDGEIRGQLVPAAQVLPPDPAST